MYKKAMVVLAAFCLLLAVAEARSAEYRKMQVSVGTHAASNSVELAALNYLKKIVEEGSGGNIEVSIFHGGTVGNEIDIAEQINTGTLEIFLSGFPVLETYAKQYNSFIVPYLYSDTEGAMRTWNGRIGDAIRGEYEKHGMYLSGPLFRGNRQLTANRPVQKVEDLKGLKIRLPETSSWITVWSQFGCIPTPIPAPEVFSALQTGVVEAQENPISANAQKGLQEVQKYTMLTNHVVDIILLGYSKKWFDGLDAATQDFLKQCMTEALDFGNRTARETEAEYRKAMEDGGMEFLEIPNIDEFKQVADEAIKKLAGNWEDWVYEQAVIDASGK